MHEIKDAFNPGEWTALLKKLRQTDRRSLMITFRNLLPQMVLYYIFLSPMVAAPLYNMLLFHPTVTGPFDAHNIVGTKIKNVFFSSQNGARLHDWYLHSDNSDYAVLINHGNGGNLTNRNPLIAMFLHDGVSVFICDYQGYGRSSGNPSLDNISKDSTSAFNWLVAQKHYSPSQIIAFGESLVTGVACQLGASQHPGGIILQSPCSSLVDLARQKMFWLNLYPASIFPMHEQFNNAETLKRPHPRFC